MCTKKATTMNVPNVLPSLHALSLNTERGFELDVTKLTPQEREEFEKASSESQPTLIITLGPTGSGKATLMYEAAEEVGVRKFERVLIDDLVENNEDYKAFIRDIILTHPFPKGMVQALLDPDEKLLQAFASAYFAARKGQAQLDKRNDSILESAFNAKKHIVFEMTGTYYPKWLIEMGQANNYRIVAAYSLVNFCELVKRNTNRAVMAMRDFLNDTYIVPAPRLPNVLDDADNTVYRTSVQTIRSFLLQLVEKCEPGKSSAGCGVDQVLIFDNNTQPMKLLVNLVSGAYTDADGNDLDVANVVAAIRDRFVLDQGVCPE